MASGARTLLMCGVLTVLTSAQGLLTAASKTDGKYAYNFATVPFFAEITKLVISLQLLRRQRRHHPEQAVVTRNWRVAVLFAIPSVIYWVHNNVQFFTLKYVDPATYQILGNLKIVSTGIVFRLFLGKRLSLLQWIALLLLTIGATTSQLKTNSQSTEGFSVFSAPLEGYLFAILSAFLSAFAAVYNEWIMKRNNDSLYWQNIQLYAFGVFFNGAGLVFNDIRNGSFATTSLIQGYDLTTFLVVANMAFSGLFVSWVMKFADSIAKVYATSMAMLLTMVLSVAFFGLETTLQMLLGITTACISVVLYYLPPEQLTRIPSPVKMMPK